MQKPWHPIFNASLWILLGGIGLSSCSSIIQPTYQPSSPKIEKLALDTSMTPKAQQLFYKQNPRIEPKQTFQKACQKVGGTIEKTILLGCFTSDGYQGNIIIQSVTDPRLAGMMEMVAAHEMLHAAYQELSPKKRSQLSSQLQRAVKRVTDDHLLTVLQEYEAGDPDIYVNELHSHLGTTLQNLGDPELEVYYRQYFQNRQQVVAFAKRSRSVLSQIESQVKQLEPELNALEVRLQEDKDDIQRAEDDLKASSQTLEQMKSTLASLQQQAEISLSQGDASGVDPFEQAQSRFNAEVEEYNWQVQNLQGRIAQFNQQFEAYTQKVTAYNELAATNRSILGAIKVNVPESTVKPVLK